MARRLIVVSGNANNVPFYAAFDTTTPTAAQDIGAILLHMLEGVPDGMSTSIATQVVSLVNS